MKILITNPDTLINPITGEFYEGINEVLESFNKEDDKGIIVMSMKKEKLAKIPKAYTPLHVNARARKGRNLIEDLKSQGINPSDCIILGSKIDDVILASNNKLLLLRADYTKFIDKSNRIFEKDYGVLGIRDSAHLQIVLSKFKDLFEPWYYRHEVDDITTLYSLTNANTMGFRGAKATKLAGEFKELLKQGDLKNFDSFALFFLLGVYVNFSEFEKIDYFAVYPSSSGDADVDLEAFAKKFRESMGKRDYGQILIRKEPVDKRHINRNYTHLETIKNQISTIVTNDKIDLTDKVVCVIDDFTSYGTSSEATRFILKRKGVKKIIFITMGKFGKEYNQVIKLPSGEHITKITTGTFNNNADIEFVESLKDLL